MGITKYLNRIQDEDTSSAAEMGFAMDSFPSVKKKRKLIKDKYPTESVFSGPPAKRAMIDLDGTIHKYSKGFEDGSIYDPPFKDAKEVIDWLKDKGYEIVIFTTRASEENARETGDDHVAQIRNVENWLTNNDIYYDRVTAEKLSADFYIDDKAITITNGNWNNVKKEIQLREVEN